MLLLSAWPFRDRARSLASSLMVLLALVAALNGCAPHRRPDDQNVFSLTIVHSNDTMGALEPCG